MLRGATGALACDRWMAFHVVLSAFGTFHELAIHSLFCAAIAWLLFRPAQCGTFAVSDRTDMNWAAQAGTRRFRASYIRH